MSVPQRTQGEQSEGSDSTSKQAWIAVGVLWVVFFINYIDRQVVFSIFPALRGTLALRVCNWA